MTSQQQLEAEIEAQRDQLADTIDQLAAKLDVKSQARAHRTQLLAAGAVVVALVVARVVWKRGHR
jgi:hypothetical protein